MQNHLPLEVLLQHAKEDANAHYQAEPNGLHPEVHGKNPEYAAMFYAMLWYDLGKDMLEEEEEERKEEFDSYVEEFLRVYTELQKQDHLKYLEQLKQINSGYFNTLPLYKRRKELDSHFGNIESFIIFYLEPLRKEPLQYEKLQELAIFLQSLAKTNPYSTVQEVQTLPLLMDQMEAYYLNVATEENKAVFLKHVADGADEWNIFHFIYHLVHECENHMRAGYLPRGNGSNIGKNIKKQNLAKAYKELSDIQLLVSQLQKILEEKDREKEAKEQANWESEK